MLSLMNKSWMRTLTLTALIGIGACSAQAPGTKPDDMSVEEHREHARKHQELAEKHHEQHDPNAHSARGKTAINPTTGVYSSEVYNPTEHHQQTANQHRRHAEQHNKAAEKLLSYQESHCAKFSDETRSVCPLMDQIKAVEDIEGGVRLTFHDGVAMQPTVEHIQCHFAFARTEGYSGMDSCPLYIEGVSVERQDGGPSVTLTTDKPEAVESLRERSRSHLSQ